ncbi:MAG: mechanosensitive ion channel family protein [Actinomycetia bacterium]|nr:mechanosensitive ion channel family protein [Actinomycetes bacterium]
MPFTQIVDITQIDELVDVSAVSPWDPFFAVLSIVTGVIIGRVGRLLIRRYGKRSGLAPNLIDLFGTIILWTVVSLSIIIALSLVGFNLAPIWLAILMIGVVGVVSGRVLLENFGAGVTLQARTPFVPGDQITTGDITGHVREVNSRVVVIDTVDGRQVLVPNAMVLRNPITNLTKHDRRMSRLGVSVVYGTDLAVAASVIDDALRSADGVLGDPGPIVQVESFDDSGIMIAARFWHLPGILDERATIHAAALSIAETLRTEGIEFAFPQLTMWWGSDPHPDSQGSAT